ncbi:HlyD family secretion protein [Xanthomonas vasicola]
MILLIGVSTISLKDLFYPDSVVVTETTSHPHVGRILVSISAMGRISAKSTVAVGTQVSGEISEVSADFNQSVSKGEIIAKINPARYQAQLQSAVASLSGAQSSLERSSERASQSLRDLQRARKLADQQLVAKADLEKEQETQRIAELDMRAAQSSVQSLQAAVQSARYDLDQTIIRSPVHGVVLERLVESGQTVASSFETPTLFRIAEDLSKLKIELAVDEADIGKIIEGNPVYFSVDAYPNRKFEGVVVQRRIAPNIQGNNANFPVVVEVTNPEGFLIPGMLADATISVAERINVLKIPSEYLVPSAGGNEIPTFGAIQDAIKENFSTVGLTKRQQKSLETELVMKLPEQGIKSRVPSELVNFFGAAAASRIVVIDDESGDPVAAIRRDRKQRLGEKFFAFRSTLNSSQQLVWDQLLSDLVESRYASVLVKNGDKVIKRSILIGMNDDVSTQVFSGLATQDLIVLQINNFQ